MAWGNGRTGWDETYMKVHKQISLTTFWSSKTYDTRYGDNYVGVDRNQIQPKKKNCL